MVAELCGLVLASLLFALAWLPASIAKARARGRRWLMSNRDSAGAAPLPAWGERAERAHRNLQEHFAAWAALLLAVMVMGWTGPTTAWAALLFPLVRAGHMAAYIGGWFWPRTLFWAVGLGCTFALAIVLLNGLAAGAA